MLRSALASLALLLPIGLAQAHFVFIVPAPNGGAQVVFSDNLEPDDESLLDKIAHTKVSAVDQPSPTPLSWKKDNGAFVLDLAGKKTQHIVGECQYGVLKKGDAKPFLLIYRAEWVGAPKVAQVYKSGKMLRIVPSGKYGYMVEWQGKPLAEAEVSIHSPKGKTKATTDKDGMFTVPAGSAGLHGFRVGKVDPQAGELAGKKYDEVRYYSTLVVETAK